MIDAGYFAKRLATEPNQLKAPSVRDICSVSNHISSAPDGWIDHWLHNEFGWFNRASDALAVVPTDQKAAFRLFAYRIYPLIFRAGASHELVVPDDVDPEPIPATDKSFGFDSVNKSSNTGGFECSPLSCKYMAREMGTNEYCLFPSAPSRSTSAGFPGEEGLSLAADGPATGAVG